MPRDFQPPAAENNQAYGVRGDQITAQKAMPLPQTNGAPPSVGGPGGTGGATPSPPGGGPPPADIMAMAQDFDPGITPLMAPSDRPNEPVTTGMAQGPGAGPEIFSQPARAQRAADVMTLMGQQSGNETLVRLADKIRQSRGFI